MSYLEESSLGCGLFTVFLLAAGTSASLETSPPSASERVTQPSICRLAPIQYPRALSLCKRLKSYKLFFFSYHQQTVLHHPAPTGLGIEDVVVDEKSHHLKNHFLLALT